jgi:hypothetical protein
MQMMSNDRLTVALPDLRVAAILYEATARVQHDETDGHQRSVSRSPVQQRGVPNRLDSDN